MSLSPPRRRPRRTTSATSHQIHGAPAVPLRTSSKKPTAGAGKGRILKSSTPDLFLVLLPLRHEVLGPGLHRFVFPSESRAGVTHELLLDLEDPGPGRLSCLCEAALHGRLCKHKRLFILGLELAAELDGMSGGHKHRKRGRRAVPS